MKWSRPGALVSAENKQQITLRLDAEVQAFFKKTGERYQNRINAVVREYVRAHRAQAEVPTWRADFAQVRGPPLMRGETFAFAM